MDVRGLRALICVLVVAGCLVTLVPSVSAAVVADGGAESGALQETPAESGQLDEAEEVHIDGRIHENGSATFTVDYRFENVSSEWEALRDDVEDNPDAYAAEEAAGWNETLQNGQNQTSREMEISNVSVATDTSSAPRDMGHVEFTFRWSAFAHVEPALLEVHDSLAGFTLVDDTTLQLSWPDEYTIREVDPTPSNPPDGSVFWDGDETEFADDQPRLVLIGNGESTSEPTDPDDEPAMPWVVVAAALSLLAVLGAAGLWLSRGEGDDPSTSPTDRPESTTNGAGGTTDAQSGPPPELLSNEERVLRLLEQRGGRVKQQEVVAQLDWTEAKTSQVVGALREDGEIEVFRIGRENVLALPDE